MNHEIYQTLVQAIRENDEKAIERLIQSNPQLNLDENDPDDPNSVPLVWEALNQKSVICMRVLLTAGANPDILDSERVTPLIISVHLGLYEMMELLVEFGANINASDMYGLTVLMACASSAKPSSLKCIRYLLHLNINVQAVDFDRRDALMVAANAGQYNKVEELLRAGASVDATDENGVTAVAWAIIRGYTNIVRLFLDYGVDVETLSDNKTTLLMHAAANGSFDIVKLLISRQANVNKVNQIGKTALILGALNQHTEIVEYLVNLNADVNHCDQNGITALHAAASSANLEAVRSLIEKGGAKIDAVADNGFTPLILACNLGGAEDTIRFLLNKGANIEAGDPSLIPEELTSATLLVDKPIYSTPLTAAACHGHRSIVELLLSRGAKVDNTYYYGYTAFMLAVENGFLDVARVLIEHGANKDAQNHAGNTALHFVCRMRKVREISFLLSLGVDSHIKDTRGNSARDLAAGPAVLALLDEYEAVK